MISSIKGIEANVNNNLNLDQDLVEQTKGKTKQILKHANTISNGNKIFRKIFITLR